MPNSDLSEQILAELRAHAMETSGRLAALETSMHALTGNGQPGRIQNLEGDVKKLNAFRWKLAGICTAGGIIGSYAIQYLGNILK